MKLFFVNDVGFWKQRAADARARGQEREAAEFEALAESVAQDESRRLPSRAERYDLEELADRLAWWLKTRRLAGSTNATIESKIDETRLELRMLRDQLMARRCR